MTRSVFSSGYDRFRQMLVEARMSANLSQVEVAKSLDRPQSYVSKYERGERRLDVVEFLEVAEVLGVDPIRFIRRLQQYLE